MCAAGVGLHLVLDSHHAGELAEAETHDAAVGSDAHAHATEAASHEHATNIEEQAEGLCLLQLAGSPAQLRAVEFSARPSIATPAPFPERPPLSIPLFTAHCSLLI